MRVLTNQPVRLAGVQSDQAPGYRPLFYRHPAGQAETGLVQPGVITQPAAEPRRHINIIRLEVDRSLIQQTIDITQIQTHLQPAARVIHRGETDLPLGSVAFALIEPRQTGNQQSGGIAGRCEKTDFAVAQIKIIEALQPETGHRIIGFNAAAVTAQRLFVIQRHVPECQITETDLKTE